MTSVILKLLFHLGEEFFPMNFKEKLKETNSVLQNK
jgi:hypothetical protein